MTQKLTAHRSIVLLMGLGIAICIVHAATVEEAWAADFVPGNYYTGGNGDTIYDWNPDGTLARSVPIPGLPGGTLVYTWGFTPEERLIVSTGPGPAEKVFELDGDLNVVKEYPVSGQAVVGPNDRMYVMPFTSNTIHVFDRTTMQQVDSFPTPDQEGSGLDFHPDGYLYISGWGSRDFARYEPVSPHNQLNRWDIPGTDGVGDKVLAGPSGHLFISHGDGASSGVVELDVTTDPPTPLFVRDYIARSLHTFDFNANDELVIYSFEDPDHVFLTYSTANGTLLDTQILSPQMQLLGLAIAPDQPAVEIIHPEPSELLLKDCTFRIEWTAENIGTPDWKFFLNKGPDHQFLRQLYPTPVDDGNGNWHADWLVPADLEDACDYDLVVKDDTTEADDHSDFFCILCRTVEIQRPLASQAVQKGCTLTIRWHSEGCMTPDWKFFLDKDGVFQEQLFPTPVDDGNGDWHADWAIPNTLDDGVDYSIVVKDDTCVADSHSPEFAILDTIILGDMNGNGTVDGGDIQLFLNTLLNQ